MKILYDTCALLNLQEDIFKNNADAILISNLSFVELEEIKSSGKKDEDIKFSARQLLHLLEENNDKYEIIFYRSSWDQDIIDFDYPVNIDSKIIITAYHNLTLNDLFVTDDLACKKLAETLKIPASFSRNNSKEDYTGYKEITFDDESLAILYSNTIPSNKNEYGLLINEYLLIKDSNGVIIDVYCWKGETHGYEQIPFQKVESKMFGKIKEKDIYQRIALHSLAKNQLTILRGAAGVGKGVLAMGHIFHQLEKGEISRVIIFANPVATKGSAKLGSINLG